MAGTTKQQLIGIIIILLQLMVGGVLFYINDKLKTQTIAMEKIEVSVETTKNEFTAFRIKQAEKLTEVKTKLESHIEVDTQ